MVELKATRAEVYEAIDSERDYQDLRWAGTASTTDNPTEEKLNFVRKVGGLAVGCMEAHGAPHRELPQEV